MMQNLYDHYKLCPDLKPKQICLVLEQCMQGKFIRLYHEHVPAHRLSNDSLSNLLQAMVIRFSGLGAETIARCYLNKRGEKPRADEGHLRCTVSRPEPGVLRCYCGTGTVAWSDQVIRASVFRSGASAT
jgi:hypothetical protein